MLFLANGFLYLESIRHAIKNSRPERNILMIPNTIKLYDNDAYQTSFNASVLSCERQGEQQSKQRSERRGKPLDTPHNQPNDGAKVDSGKPLYDIILDQTLFFPEEGGQNADGGTLNSHPVLDVQIKDGVIRHTTDIPFSPGSQIEGQIHWQPRYSNMQQHSGEHVISGLVHARFGYDNVGFHLGIKNVTLDFNGILTPEQLEQIESLANEAIWKNINISAAYLPKKQLDTLEYRSKIALAGPVRIVTIPGYDICACCAPHVRQTGEIGIIKITDAIKYKGGMRISIQCGDRALDDYRMKQQQLSAVSVLLSSKLETASDAVGRLKDENFALKGQIMALQTVLMEQKANAVPADAANLLLFEPQMESGVHKKYVNLLTAKCPGICAVFAGSDTEGYRYMIASSCQDVRPLNDRLKKELSTKGGGSKEMVQGSCSASREQLYSLFDGCNMSFYRTDQFVR